MANVHTLAAGLQDGTGVPAMSKVTANTRVQTQTGTITLISDVFTWPGPSTTGNFVVPMARVTIDGVPAINQASAGVALNASSGVPVPVPTVIVTTDSLVSGQ